MHEQIERALREIERERDVRILYACESGSRAWGFASPDSDYDPRFIYVLPRQRYLSIEQERDVIEVKIEEGDLDLAGWDLRKALRLFRKSNPPMLEWMISPIVYIEDAAFMSELRRLSAIYYSPERCFMHYLSMARTNLRGYLLDEMVPLKKYLYVLRPILACRWIEMDLGQPPVPFHELLERTVDDENLRKAIDELLERKMASGEAGVAPRIDAISDFLESELRRLATVRPDVQPMPGVEMLDELFRTSLEP
jgi:uncharacterized protein